jgi:quercetin dioxygenase-like cupin family protein
MNRVIVTLALALVTTALGCQRQGEDSESDGSQAANARAAAAQAVTTPGEIRWEDAPAPLPSGTKRAVLEGDPTKPGPFTMRLLLPAGSRIDPHIHPNLESVSVISGALNVGVGNPFQESTAQVLPAGSFLFMAPKARHFAFTREETIIQLHGVGPEAVTYLNPTERGSPTSAAAPAEIDKVDFSMFRADGIPWMAPPPISNLPSTLKLALLQGNPLLEGPYTFRLLFPAGSRLPPHWHPNIEHLTVISGSFQLGLGATSQKQSAERMPAGSFALVPPEMQHFVFATEKTVVQLHGVGPGGIRYTK